jgi:hypothetical protein
VRRLAHCSYKALASTFVQSSTTSVRMVQEIAWKIKAEMRKISVIVYEAIQLGKCLP